MMSKRPFRLHDLDIDVEVIHVARAVEGYRLILTQTPVEVDIDCIDGTVIADLQERQHLGCVETSGVTTISSTLSQLELYRIKSRIM